MFESDSRSEHYVHEHTRSERELLAKRSAPGPVRAGFLARECASDGELRTTLGYDVRIVGGEWPKSIAEPGLSHAEGAGHSHDSGRCARQSRAIRPPARRRL